MLKTEQLALNPYLIVFKREINEEIIKKPSESIY